MLRDFSQPFTIGPAEAFLLVEDSVSGKFIALESAEDTKELGEGHAHRTFRLNIDPRKDFATQIAKFLHRQGSSLISLRELTRETNVAFSFMDATPGSQSDSICFHAIVDVVA